MATGDQLWPLPESLGVGDVWDGGDGQAVSLGYDIGGSLVAYVAARWGAHEVRPFAQAVAAAEPTEAGMDAALGEALGVTWRDFFAGWRRYVLSGASVPPARPRTVTASRPSAVSLQNCGVQWSSWHPHPAETDVSSC